MSKELIEALLKPSTYSHPVDNIRLLETHISWVILTGDYVYKIKKPVDFGFLNFTDLTQRGKFCEMEVQLNQRLAPELYDKVIPISGTPENPLLNDNSNPFEYAIVMHQFSQKGMLDTLAEQGKLELTQLLDVTGQLAEFHHSAEVSTADQHYGSPEHVWYPVEENFDQIRPLLEEQKDHDQLDRLSKWAADVYQTQLPLIKERKANGLIKACHGDVHLGNITIFRDQVTLFDCIEFNEDYRWTDTMADLGFLAMDLDSRGLSEFAPSVVNHYMEISGDYRGLGLLNFYKSYRALVRAKVILFRLHGDEISEAEKQEVFKEYRRYSDLAESYCQQENPFLVTMQGLSGSGKSTVGRQLVAQSNCIMLRTDVERKRLFNLKPFESSHQANLDIYTPEVTTRTYETLKEIAAFLLQNRISVIIDSAALKESERSLFKDVAEEQETPFAIVKCLAPDPVLQDRILKRQSLNNDASEASVELIAKQHQWEEPITEFEQRYTITLNTDSENWQAELETALSPLIS